MSGLDLEGVLAAHDFQPTTAPYGWCRCGESHTAPSHRAHVAAVLREQVAEAIRSNREAFLQSPGLDRAWIAGWHSATDHIAAQFAPARVPSEEE